jgi:hypothetical protein
MSLKYIKILLKLVSTPVAPMKIFCQNQPNIVLALMWVWALLLKFIIKVQQ